MHAAECSVIFTGNILHIFPKLFLKQFYSEAEERAVIGKFYENSDTKFSWIRYLIGQDLEQESENMLLLSI